MNDFFTHETATVDEGCQIGWMSECGHRLNFDEKGMAKCMESHEYYQLKDGKVFKI